MTSPVTNPLHNDNRLKLGVFCLNGEAGGKTKIPERYVMNWENSLDVATLADSVGFEAIVPFARFAALVHPRHSSGNVYDTHTWSAAIAARTSYSCVMITCHVMNYHPVIAAKACATMDHISNGRFALNIVCGWFVADIEMMGFPNLDHDERYVYAREWISIIKRLWSEEDAFDYDGKYFQFKGGMSQPKPRQKPYPPLMNAGGSPAGREFVAKKCDIAFVQGETKAAIAEQVALYRARAQEEGRKIQVWTTCAVIQGDTNEAAEAYMDYCARHPDDELLDDWFAQRKVAPEVATSMRRKYAAAGSGYLLIGNAEKIADELGEISAAGVDGVLFQWVDHKDGITRFARDVLPRLEAKGLRAPFPGVSSLTQGLEQALS